MIVIVKDGDGYVQVTDDGVTTTLFPNIDDTGEGGGGGGGGTSGYSLDDVITHENFVGNITYTGNHVIYPFAFYNATNMTGFSAPNVTRIDGQNYPGGSFDSRVFANCTNLESISLPNVTDYYYAGYCFSGCKKITNWDLAFDRITDLGGGAFRNSSFPSAVFKSHSQNNAIYTYCFADCKQMEYIDIKCKQLQTQCFANSGLKTLILRNTNSIVTLQNINVFSGTPFSSSGTGGKLYVPSALISSYQSASNWSTILGYDNNSINSIEGSIYETKYADGTPIT